MILEFRIVDLRPMFINLVCGVCVCVDTKTPSSFTLARLSLKFLLSPFSFDHSVIGSFSLCFAPHSISIACVALKQTLSTSVHRRRRLTVHILSARPSRNRREKKNYINISAKHDSSAFQRTHIHSHAYTGEREKKKHIHKIEVMLGLRHSHRLCVLGFSNIFNAIMQPQ